MKNFTLALSLFLALGIYNTVMAQEEGEEIIEMTKAERKEWKKKAKALSKNPAELKRIMDENEDLSSTVNSLDTKNKSLMSQVEDKNAKISDLQDDMAKLRSDLSAAKSRASTAAAESAKNTKSNRSMKGVVFKVQIGAFRNKDLSKYFDNNENFGGENDGDGTQKITLGQFKDYWEADTFKKYLREMGVKDAWIVPYKDGTRVPIKDVLEGVISSEG